MEQGHDGVVALLQQFVQAIQARKHEEASLAHTELSTIGAEHGFVLIGPPSGAPGPQPLLPQRYASAASASQQQLQALPRATLAPCASLLRNFGHVSPALAMMTLTAVDLAASCLGGGRAVAALFEHAPFARWGSTCGSWLWRGWTLTHHCRPPPSQRKVAGTKHKTLASPQGRPGPATGAPGFQRDPGRLQDAGLCAVCDLRPGDRHPGWASGWSGMASRLY